MASVLPTNPWAAGQGYKSVPYEDNGYAGQATLLPMDGAAEEGNNVESPAAKRVRELKQLVDSGGPERALQDRALLIKSYVWAKSSLFIEVWLFVFFFYYVDVLLDVKMIYTFYRYEDYKFIVATCVGISGGIIFSVFEMTRLIKESDPVWMILLAGFLVPFQLHVLFLCIYSTKVGYVHPLIYCTKFAESALEGTVSAIIQTYAVIFRDLSWDDLLVSYASIASSYASIAFAFTQIDNRGKGLQGLPGVSEGWTPRLALVMLFRTCEVVSRIVSLGLFQAAVRNEQVFAGFSFGTQGGPFILGVDIVIMILLTAWYQGERGCWNNLMFSMPSVISWINPMLLRENAFTIPAWVYYLVRLLELLFMSWVAMNTEVFHGGHWSARDVFDNDPSNNFHGLKGFGIEFANDKLVAAAAGAATILGGVLLLIIRIFCTDHVMLHDKRMFATHAFNRTEDVLCERLLNVSDSMRSGGSRATDCLAFHGICARLIQDATTKLSTALEDAKPGKLGNRSMSSANLSGNPVRAGAAIVNWRDYLNWRYWFSIDLEGWLQREYDQAVQAATYTVADMFVEHISLGFNLSRYVTCQDFYTLETDTNGDKVADQRHLFREYLGVLNRALQQDTGSRVKLADPALAYMLLKVFPGWHKFDMSCPEAVEHDLLLFAEKCSLISNVVKCGWQHHRGFAEIARQFHLAFGARTQAEVELVVPDREGTVDPHDWIMRIQMHSLVTMYRSIPDDLKNDEQLLLDPEFGLFRKDREVKAIMDGAMLVVAARGAAVTGTLKASAEMSLEASLEFVLASFKNEDITLSAEWSKKHGDQCWKINKTLGILKTNMEELKLQSIELAEGDKAAEEFPVTRGDQLTSVFEKREDGSLVRNLQQMSVRFHMVRLVEIDDHPLERLRTGGWKVHTTAMLKLFSALSLRDMEFLCGGFGSDPMLESFRKYQLAVEGEVKRGLDEKMNLLVSHGNLTVDPNTACGSIEKYKKDRDAKGGISTIEEIRKMKLQNQEALVKYEDLVEKMREYLDSADKVFQWSVGISDHCAGMLKSVKKSLQDVRKRKDAFWNKEEGVVTKAAKDQETAARTAEKAAQKKKDEADKARLLMLDEKERLKELMVKAQADFKLATEEKEWAMGALQAAQMEQAEANTARAKAEKEIQVARQREKAAFERESAAINAQAKINEEKKKLEKKQADIENAYRQAQSSGQASGLDWFRGFLT